ncbi:MAG: hypothetical protein K9N51_02470 [Candidatus Pacebacteria bacterium]|nr:hypothetical protein [Candidatus Paceibacterota bacterium]
MKSRIMGCLMAVLIPVLGFGAAADEAFTLYNAEDASPALRVKNGYKYPVTFIWLTAGSNAANRIEIKEASGAVTTNIVGTAPAAGITNTISEMQLQLNAASNAAGERLITWDWNCALVSDEFATRVLTETNIISAGTWGKAATWDTSAALHWDVYLPGKIAESGGQESRKVIQNWYGLPSGQGNLTLEIFQDGTEKYQETVLLPDYIRADTNGAAAASWTTNHVWNLSKSINWPCPRRVDTLLRATRAGTAAAGGGMGITVAPTE